MRTLNHKNIAIGLGLTFAVTLLGLPVVAGHESEATLGGPISGLTAEELALFEEGKALFEKDFTPKEGLGPIYNGRSCVKCHVHPGTGGSENGTAENVTHFGVVHDGRFLSSFEIGGPVQQRLSIAGDPEAPDCQMPAENAIAHQAANPLITRSIRHTPPVFGFGLIDGIADADIVANERAERRFSSVKGFTNWAVEMEIIGAFTGLGIDFTRTQPFGASRVGRFGWKSQTATLHMFSADPFNIELGMSNPWFKRENTPDLNPVPPECDVATNKVNDPDGQMSLRLFYFQALVAPPPRARITGKVARGERVFDEIGCTDCHRKSYRTVDDYYMPWPDGTAHRVEALSGKTFHPFSDFLVHDMGPELADGRVMGRAAGNFWRTTPLWGARFKTRFLHDGSATSMGEAIMRHGGEGAASRNAYAALPPGKKKLLHAFLDSL